MSTVRNFLTESKLWMLVGVAGLVAAAAIVALVFAISTKVHAVPDVARDVATRVSHQVAKDAARVQAVDATATALRASTLEACHRSNALHHALNKQDAHIYEAFAAVAGLETQTAHTKPSGKIVDHGAYERHLRIEEQAARAIPNAAGNMQYLPPTDCGLAFVQGSTYQPSPPIPWAEHLKQSKRGH